MTRPADPWVLTALVFLPLLLFVYARWVRPRRAVLQFSTWRFLHDVRPSFRQPLRGSSVALLDHRAR